MPCAASDTLRPVMNETLPPMLLRILRETPEFQGAFLVGGCVRDHLLRVPVKDFDVEVFGLGYERLTNVLSRWGRTDVVGRSFGVVKLTVAPGETYDFTLPRGIPRWRPGIAASRCSAIRTFRRRKPRAGAISPSTP